MNLSQNESVAPSCCVTCKPACAAFYACQASPEVSRLKMWEPKKTHMESQSVISTMMLWSFKPILTGSCSFWGFFYTQSSVKLLVFRAGSPWNCLSYVRRWGLLVPVVSGSCLPDAIPPANRQNLVAPLDWPGSTGKVKCFVVAGRWR